MTDTALLPRHIAFILELDKLKAVLRRTKPLGLDRHENSAEHSWQVCLLALSLTDYADEPVDIDRVIRMLLVHDIGEIDVGDHIVFSDAAQGNKGEELIAVKRIFGLLPEPRAAELLALWCEFEDNATPSARFANAMDRLMPALQNLHNDGQSWRENGIRPEQVRAKVYPKIAAGSRALGDYFLESLAEAETAGLFDATR
ncbi:HD domain-containing protein [Crenobacter cavernae]|uniref:HD domain-containing protein n=1 Tax=Crenobacter cavernae TaxID=2290923 RepID=A0ABY0FD13_9NEIS|nr:HD domain-containing protein [Crenobacter cavernae]RXZ42234.1 HD domain-containing protein [Crenobacter cavernae]